MTGITADALRRAAERAPIVPLTYNGEHIGTVHVEAVESTEAGIEVTLDLSFEPPQ